MKYFRVELKSGYAVSNILATGLPQAWRIAKSRFGKDEIHAVVPVFAIDPVELQMAVERAGDENSGTWSTEGANVMRKFSGSYSIAEIEALLRDMRRVQAELDRIAR